MRRTLAAIALSLAGTGCTLALAPASPPDPRFGRDHLASLEAGMTPDAVRGVLGEPLRMRRAGATTHWHYRHTTYLRGCATLVFGLTVSEQPHEVREIDLAFGGDGLAAATLTERMPERTVRVHLLSSRPNP
jgi:outer membrane protein assembly factor BamE (lipoprotein component of BamABCDE complex)